MDIDYPLDYLIFKIGYPIISLSRPKIQRIHYKKLLVGNSYFYDVVVL
jgi:hypothetical protein